MLRGAMKCGVGREGQLGGGGSRRGDLGGGGKRWSIRGSPYLPLPSL